MRRISWERSPAPLPKPPITRRSALRHREIASPPRYSIGGAPGTVSGLSAAIIVPPVGLTTRLSLSEPGLQVTTAAASDIPPGRRASRLLVTARGAGWPAG